MAGTGTGTHRRSDYQPRHARDRDHLERGYYLPPERWWHRAQPTLYKATLCGMGLAVVIVAGMTVMDYTLGPRSPRQPITPGGHVVVIQPSEPALPPDNAGPALPSPVPQWTPSPSCGTAGSDSYSETPQPETPGQSGCAGYTQSDSGGGNARINVGVAGAAGVRADVAPSLPSPVLPGGGRTGPATTPGPADSGDPVPDLAPSPPVDPPDLDVGTSTRTHHCPHARPDGKDCHKPKP